MNLYTPFLFLVNYEDEIQVFIRKLIKMENGMYALLRLLS